MGTVQSAQETVEDSIQMAKDTVATVKRNFDIKYQVEQHPWAMVGGCFVAGLALGGLFPTGRRRSRQAPDRLAGNETPPAGSPRLVAEQHSKDKCDTAAPRPGPIRRLRIGLVSSASSMKRSTRSKGWPSAT